MSKPDDLLERAERLAREQQARQHAQTQADRPYFARAASGLVEQSVLLRRILETLDVLWNRWLKPFALIINPLVRLYWRFIRWVFTKLSFKDGVYKKHRGALAALGLALFTVFAGWTLVTRAVPFTFGLIYDAIAINLVSHQETMIFSQPQNVEGAPDVLKVYACRAFPCEGQTDSVEYRFRDSAYLDLVRLLTRFEPHDPSELAGAFVSEENACRIKAYGVRNKWLDWYPYITQATCRPVNGVNSQEVLDALRN